MPLDCLANYFVRSRENQEIEVVIDDIGSRGDGIAKLQGFLVFVPRCKIGERIRVRITSVREKFATEGLGEIEGHQEKGCRIAAY
jgi:predicted RNA-binding protein with TRAM domain